ncbi:hypothetical protein [Amedibacillus dolichus]|uniref:hypothetical protein n=1 Tax=Amedibacillus dolichus TaxID=31971 RepID=UPI001B1406AC|nr:hypothetical protein [Amedibacillus dolichus]MBO5478713.1 hypothetical protein [Clostridia bacterium]MBP3680294.1 hypothetical protein [Clostridia bacterium]
MKENGIETTIKQLELILKARREHKEIIECVGGSCMNCDPDIKALVKSIDILSDYKRVLQENEYMHNELDKQQTKINKYAKENEELKKFHIQDNKHLDFIMENSITVQKVKDKIEKEIKYHEKNILDIENITMLKGKTAKEEAEIEFNKYAIVVLKKMLQELIEGRK